MATGPDGADVVGGSEVIGGEVVGPAAEGIH